MWTQARYWIRLKTRKTRLANAQQVFKQFLETIGPGDIAIDCGANIGDITDMIAETGATVHAVEPDPVAFNHLSSRFENRSNVILHNFAVGEKEGVLPLYTSLKRDQKSTRGSTSTSLLKESYRVSKKPFAEVQVIDFVKFVKSLEKYPTLIKMDIEGAEVAVLEKMFDCEITREIGKIFVETHEKLLPSLRNRTFQLIDRASQLKENNVNMDWK